MKRILLVYDGTDEARAALDRAAEVARGLAAEVGGATVVLGSRDLNPIERLLEGSVSAKVPGRSAATVVIARDERR